MKKTFTFTAVVLVSLLPLLGLCGCKDETSRPENQELTKQRQAKIRERKNQ